jgi:hypothetical protein
VTNGSAGIGPLEAGKLNDQVWEFGTLLQNTSDAAVLSVLEAGFTPFNDGNAQAQQWRVRRDAAQAQAVGGGVLPQSRRALVGEALRTFRRGEDWVKYEPFLLTCLRLFGKSIHVSLERSCSRQLSHLGGDQSAAHAAPWMVAIAKKLTAVNDRAETGFAATKHQLKEQGNLEVWRAGADSTARFGRFYELPEVKRKSQYQEGEKRGLVRRLGPAWTLPEPLLLAIRGWGAESGEYMASWEREDKAKALAHEAKRVEGNREERRLAVQAKVVKTQRAQAVTLASTKAVLADNLTAHASGGAKEAYLKEQHGGHMVRASAVNYRFPFSTKMGALAGGVAASVAHLTELVGKMIDDGTVDTAAELTSDGDMVIGRKLHSASAPLCSSVVAERDARTAAEAAALELQDDGELLELEEKFLNKNFTTVGFEGRGAKRVAVEESFVVMKIYWESDREVWYADCVEIGDDGEIPAASKTKGGVVMVNAIIPFTLEEMEEDIARYESS